MPETEWEETIKKGVEIAIESFGASFGSTLGVALAEQIMSSLFGSGDSAEEKFAKAIEDLKRHISKTVDKGFLREHCGRVAAESGNLKDYFKVRNFEIENKKEREIHQKILVDIKSRLRTEIETLALFEGQDTLPEALTTLVYAINVFLLTLRALADYDRDYYKIAMEESRICAEKVTTLIGKLEKPIRNSISKETFLRSDKLDSGNLCKIKSDDIFGEDQFVPGVTFKIYTLYTDELSNSYSDSEEKCVPYPKDIFGNYDMNADLTKGFKESEVFISTENQRIRKSLERNQKLDEFLLPNIKATEGWKNIASTIESKLKII
ncbi:hypothetical protein [Lysinibacillus capsici]|uniref:hypothetical protein n=1 Tax=Lysinibacillus capsici TaxID=2115968 RepID=UPI003682E1EB